MQSDCVLGRNRKDAQIGRWQIGAVMFQRHVQLFYLYSFRFIKNIYKSLDYQQIIKEKMAKKVFIDLTMIALIGFVMVVVLYIYTSTLLGPEIGPTGPYLTQGGLTAALSSLNGYPRDIFPGVNVVDGTASVSIIKVRKTPKYEYPENFTFMSNWNFVTYDPEYVVLTTTNSSNDTARAIQGSGAWNQVFGNVPILDYERVVFSVDIVSVSDQSFTFGNGQDGIEAVGVGISSSSPSQVLASDSVAFYNDGAVWTNNSLLGCNYAPFMGSNHVIDVAVDRVSSKIWYRVDGNAWQT